MKRKISFVLIFIFLFAGIFNVNAGAEAVTLIVMTASDFDLENFEALGFGKITNRYEKIFTGFSIESYEKYIESIRAVPGVVSVSKETTYSVPETEPADSAISLFSEQTGYLGEGAAVAVIDSSFNVSHEIFALTDEATAKYTIDDISAILSASSLAAESAFLEAVGSVLSSGNVYKSAKVPFAFDYAAGDTNVKSSVYHGNAVAGIIGGNSASYTGVLPEAQLILMKVGTDSGAIKETAICSAFEDVLALDVDAVNLSIGSVSGFSAGYIGGTALEAAFESIRSKGIFVSVAAGNSGILNSNGLSEYSEGGEYPYTGNTDYGLISSPASAPSATAVAAADFSSGAIADFSSRGVTPDLILKPDISAQGTSRSVATVSGYATGSGTSFASPELCAKSVIVKKEIEARGVSADEITKLTENLLFNTADILCDDNGVALSPRAQGSGLVNTDRAVSAKAVLYGSDGKAKLSLKDGLSTAFTISFQAENLTEESISYTPSLELITDGYSNGRITGASVSVPHTVSFSPAETALSPNEVKTVTATVAVDENWAAENAAEFTNGFWLEGFISLSSAEETLSIPFTGYYGSWTAPPVFLSEKESFGFGFAETFASKASLQNLFYLGNNYFEKSTADSAPDSSKAAFSPNGDGLLDNAKIFYGLLRNAKLIYIEFQDESGNEVYSTGIYYAAKTGGLNLFNYSDLWWDGTDNDGNPVSDGQYRLYAAAFPDYGSGYTVSDEIYRYIYVDTEPPEISGVSVAREDGKDILTLTLSDNHLIQAAEVSDSEGNSVGIDTEISDAEASFDITGESELVVKVTDYAFNSTEKSITVADEYIAYYDSSGILSRVTVNPDNVYESDSAFGGFNVSFNEGEAFARVFIWTKSLSPVYYTEEYNN